MPWRPSAPGTGPATCRSVRASVRALPSGVKARLATAVAAGNPIDQGSGLLGVSPAGSRVWGTRFDVDERTPAPPSHPGLPACRQPAVDLCPRRGAARLRPRPPWTGRRSLDAERDRRRRLPRSRGPRACGVSGQSRLHRRRDPGGSARAAGSPGAGRVPDRRDLREQRHAGEHRRLPQGRGPARFCDQSFQYLCSGALVSDTDGSTTIPYLLTANHCISTQSAASTLEVFWDYKTASCNGSIPALARCPGATAPPGWPPGKTRLHLAAAQCDPFRPRPPGLERQCLGRAQRHRHLSTVVSGPVRQSVRKTAAILAGNGPHLGNPFLQRRAAAGLPLLPAQPGGDLRWQLGSTGRPGEPADRRAAHGRMWQQPRRRLRQQQLRARRSASLPAIRRSRPS